MYNISEKGTTLLTPEQVRLQYRTAGLGSRAAAHLVDTLLLGAATLIILLGFAGVARLMAKNSYWGNGYEYIAALLIILVLLMNIGYFIVMEARGGQTIGKRIFGLRVVQARGGSASLLAIIIRTLFRLVDYLPTGYFVGVVSILISPSDKRIGDMVAGTIVVLESGAEHKKQLSRVDRKIARMQAKGMPLPELAVTEEQRRTLSEGDWQLLQGWAERLEPSPQQQVMELEGRIFVHFTTMLGHDQQQYATPASYLSALYLMLREDWEL